ncbi:MAG: CDP-glycerol glycerophosphotransferase family protein [Lachnospiraceae bacterium]|nr:CDP-glycerol glycerophosphotransferase family protein [Lachnospiraceae bacterium]
MRRLILGLLNFINRLVPKGNIVIFNSFPDLEGNAYALFKYMVREQGGIFDEYRMVWSVNAGSDVKETDKRLRSICKDKRYSVVKKLSIRGLFTFFRASGIVTTHNYITGLYTAKGQTHYHLAHGMPYKAVGNRIKNANEKDLFQADITIADSEYFREIVSDVLNMPEERVYVTGQPADDAVLDTDNALEKLGIDHKMYTRVILWSPTYRQSDVGSLRSDGFGGGFDTEYVLTTGADEISAVLQEKNMLLMVKFHPMDVLRNRVFDEHRNIMIIKPEQLSEAGVTFNELMGECDVFLTDYSSAFETYMLTGRPVAFIRDDMEDFERERGFSIDNPDDLAAGERIRNMEQLKAYLMDMDSMNERWKEKYEKARSLIHAYTDGRASQRVYRLIFDGKGHV